MRASCDVDDAAWTHHFNVLHIYLAGSERSNVITADEGKRWALVWKLDEFGHKVKDDKGEFVTQEFWGDVCIKCEAWIRHLIEHPLIDSGVC